MKLWFVFLWWIFAPVLSSSGVLAENVMLKRVCFKSNYNLWYIFLTLTKVCLRIQNLMSKSEPASNLFEAYSFSFSSHGTWHCWLLSLVAIDYWQSQGQIIWFSTYLSVTKYTTNRLTDGKWTNINSYVKVFNMLLKTFFAGIYWHIFIGMPCR